MDFSRVGGLRMRGGVDGAMLFWWPLRDDTWPRKLANHPFSSPNEGENAGLRDLLPAPILEAKCHQFRFRRSPLEALLGPGKVLFGASCISS